MKLSDLQAAFQAAILAGDAEDAGLLDIAAPPRGADRATMLGVYVNAYRLRLSEYFDEDYPALRVLLGDDDFEALVEAFIDANPSSLRNARWYSTQLPDFMRESEAWGSNARAIGLACFERALTDAYDAADAPVKNIETLAEFSPEDWPRLAFEFHPSLRLLDVAAGVLRAYDAATSDEERAPADQDDASVEPPMEAADRETIAVWRREFDPNYRELDADEFVALNEAIAGHSFGDICQLVAFQNESQSAAERLAQFLVTWFTEGLVIGLTRPSNPA